jgi:hypothetical protein
MSDLNKGGFAAKHGADAVADPVLRAEIEAFLDGSEIPCAVAFDIAARSGASPEEFGRTVDLMNIRLVKCQLGLFGYGPGKKIVQARQSDDARLIAAIEAGVVDGRIPCREAWAIAARFKVPKLMIGGICEAMGIRIKPCQLGAF